MGPPGFEPRLAGPKPTVLPNYTMAPHLFIEISGIYKFIDIKKKVTF